MRPALLRSCAALLLTGLAVAASPQGAQAKPVERERYEFSLPAFTDEICGIDARLAVEGSGLFKVREVKGSDGQAFFGFDNFEYIETWTTDAGSVVIHHNGTFKEKRATRVEGPVTYTFEGVQYTSDDVWTFQFQESGIFRVYDMDGNVLLKDTGVFRAQEQFDTLGDSQPGGRPIDGTFEVLKDGNGQSFDEEQFCSVVLAELM